MLHHLHRLMSLMIPLEQHTRNIGNVKNKHTDMADVESQFDDVRLRGLASLLSVGPVCQTESFARLR